MAELKLQIVSQEKQLVNTTASKVTAPTTEGEITLLPYHIPLFTQLQTGVLLYTTDGVDHHFVVSEGFLTINPDNEVTVMVDSAVNERDISEEKAEEALKAAKETIGDKTASERELIMAEAAMRRAMLEIRLAQQSKRSRS